MAIYKETIWVTGASSGIGRALAKRLAEAGNNVIVTARRQELLDQLCQEHPGMKAVVADLGDPECIESLRHQLSAISGHLDRVVLNAGTCEYFDIDNPDWSMLARVMQANYASVVHSVAASLPLLEASQLPRPHIVGMASLASRVPFPRAEAYGASKAALDYFLASLGVDLASKNIDVSIIQPGFVKTPLTQRNDFDMPFLMDTNEAVTAVMAGIEKRSLYVRFPRRLHWLLSVGHLLMNQWYRRIGPRLVRT